MFNHNLPFDLSGSLILYVRRGSRAYGTNLATSDYDYQGICIPPTWLRESIFHNFDQFEHKAPEKLEEATVFSLRRFITLASQCNPNVLEALFVDSNDIEIITEKGQLLIDHRKLFLSERIGYTFSGYAISQLKRIKTHKQWLMNPLTEKPKRSDFGLPESPQISGDTRTAMWKLIELHKQQLAPFLVHRDKEDVFLFWDSIANIAGLINDRAAEDTVSAILLDHSFTANQVEILKAEKRYTQAMTEYTNYQTWLANRNRSRHELEAQYGYDVKHGMHLVRLLRMGIECLTTGQLLVRRPDAEELLAIRQGAWTFDQLIEYTEKEKANIENICRTHQSVLPHHIDQVKLEKLYFKLIEINE